MHAPESIAPIDPLAIIAMPFVHMRSRYMERVNALAPWRQTVTNLRVFQEERLRTWRRASSPGSASCAKLGDLLADDSPCRARSAPRYSKAPNMIPSKFFFETSDLRPRGENNPEIRVERTSCVVVIHQKGTLPPAEPIVHGGARAGIAGPLALASRCWHPSGATGGVLVPERGSGCFV